MAGFRNVLVHDYLGVDLELKVIAEGPSLRYVGRDAVTGQGQEPVAALVFERAGGAAAVTPLVWRGGRFRSHHVQLASGSLLQIGSLVDAVPGVELWEVPAPAGGSYWIDIGLEERRLGAEYDGEEFHTEDDAEHDEGRRDWMRRTENWTIVVARKANIYGPRQDIDQMLRRAAAEAGLRR